MSESQIILVRYWAAARAAAGIAEERLEASAPTTLADLRADLVRRHGPGLAGILGVCSVLVGAQPVASSDPAQVRIAPGDTVEFLPPFAGG